MAADRCPACLMNFPLALPKCPLCKSALDRIENAEPDDDWQDEVDRRKREVKRLGEREDDGLILWRREELRRLGFDALHAEVLADLVGVSVHDASDLVGKGATPEEAFLILY